MSDQAAKPIVCRLPDGAEYGFALLAAAQELYGDEVVAVRYQDGGSLAAPEAPSSDDAPADDALKKSASGAARGTKA